MINELDVEAKTGMEIDERVRKLVCVLNGLPGIHTFSSCGGHDNPGPGQARLDNFYVCFSIDVMGMHPTKKAWKSVGVITEATMLGEVDFMQKYGERGCPYYNLMVCNLFDEIDDDSISMLDFEIKGRFGANPDDLADLITEVEKGLRMQC
jgi:hypothetical protein